MSLFSIRSRREPVDMPVKLFLQDRRAGSCSSNYISGIIVNLNRNGACFVAEKVMLDGRHIFFTTQEGAENVLEISGLECDGKPVTIEATAVWMDSCIYREKPAFKIGVQFSGQYSSLAAVQPTNQEQ